MLRKLPNWDEGIDYEEHEEDKVTIQSLYGTKECFEYQSMQKAADRMANNAALVNSYTDLLFFIEVAFPNTLFRKMQACMKFCIMKWIMRAS